MGASGRAVQLRDGERDRYLKAYIDDHGNLHLDGEDFGPEIAVITPRESYEWFTTIAADDIPRLIGLLDGREDEGVVDLLEREYTGERADELERRLRESDIEVARTAF